MLMATILTKLFRLTEGQVRGLQAEQRARPGVALEQLALGFRLISAEQAERARGLHGALAVPSGQPKPLGHTLLEAGLADGAQLVWALAEQRRTGERLGAIVVRRGWVTAIQLEMLLVLQRREGRSLVA
ncbi:MAG: hypothetical protein JWM80_2288 [Cyanobacteria bacterium RYN_339]|nr:hypothetical protein [Cyanobacteria bacterium RYN_339]